MLTVDNELYNRPGDMWWDDATFLAVLRTAINPARFAYFREVLTGRLQMDPVGKTALDVGCGGGLLAEEFARLGCKVTGIDPSERSLQTARMHARQSELDIDYRQGVGEELSFSQDAFDIVYCCDVLEHVSDLDRVIAETARVLRPGGVYLYDTINRTLLSKLVTIKLLQDWRWSHLAPPDLHSWNMFIKPEELRILLERHGLEQRDLTGMRPAANPLRLLALLWQSKRGKIDYGELGRRAVFELGEDTSVSYLGYAVKPVEHTLQETPTASLT